MRFFCYYFTKANVKFLFDRFIDNMEKYYIICYNSLIDTLEVRCMANKRKSYTSYRVLDDGAKTSRPEPPKKEDYQKKDNQKPKTNLTNEDEVK